VPPRERGMAHRSAISPDHKWVLVVEMDNGGWLPCRLVPFDGTSSGRIVGPTSGGCTYVAWSPDGAWMYFSSDAGGRFHIWRQRFPDGTPQQVTSGATEEEGIAMMPDGRSLITSVGLKQSIVMLHDANGERPVSSVSHAASPQFLADGKYIFYLVGPREAQEHQFVSGELYRVDLQTGNTEHLLPGVSVDSYAVSSDGKRIVYSAADAQGHDHLWSADMDLRSSPRRYSSLTDEDQPSLDDNGNVYFRAVEGGSNFLYRMKQDGSDRTKLVSHPILEFHGVSPDGRWALVYQSPSAQTDGLLELVATPLAGGTPVTVCAYECFAMWGNHGKTLAVHLYMKGGKKKTVFVPVFGDGPQLLPPEGYYTDEDLVVIKGAKIMDDVIIPGPNAAEYAYLRQSVHRNLYRIPLR
jgi:eukaryotic-like serine/threonine-protein kinase